MEEEKTCSGKEEKDRQEKEQTVGRRWIRIQEEENFGKEEGKACVEVYNIA